MKKPKKKVRPIPKGYPILTPYLIVNGAAQAIEFYVKALGAKERMRMPAPGGKIGHAELEIGTSLIMLADECPGFGTSPATLKGTPVSFLIYVKDVDAAFKRAIAAGGSATQSPENKFYGDRMGAFTDPYSRRR
ncbi:MAG: VOC family protein [Planctomycetes bacterium]|nr:VOC family protein [Planctomycetota bacterium]